MHFAVFLSALIGSTVAIGVESRSSAPALVSRDVGQRNCNPEFVTTVPNRLHDEIARSDRSAKRLAAGLPPKAPRRRWTPTRETCWTYYVESLRAHILGLGSFSKDSLLPARLGPLAPLEFSKLRSMADKLDMSRMCHLLLVPHIHH